MTYDLTVTRDIDQPPGGWRYTVAETGFTLTGGSARILRTNIANHLKANGMEVPDDDWMNDAICRQMNLGEPFCGEPEKRRIGKMPFPTMATAVRFLRTVKAALEDRRIVTREEAQRRMAICMKCPLATSIGGCWGCSAIMAEVKRILKRTPAKADVGKEFCGSCLCYLEAKVVLLNSTLDKAENADMPPYDARCWRLEEKP